MEDFFYIIYICISLYYLSVLIKERARTEKIKYCGTFSAIYCALLRLLFDFQLI